MPDHPFHVRGGAVAREIEQFGLVVRPGDAGQGPHLRVRELSLGEGLGDQGQRGEAAGHAHLLAGGAERDAGAPGEPVGAGAEPLPAFRGVVDLEKTEEPVGGGRDVGAEKGDLVAEGIEVGVEPGRTWARPGRLALGTRA